MTRRTADVALRVGALLLRRAVARRGLLWGGVASVALAVAASSCLESPLAEPCRAIAPGTPLSEAAARLEAVGAEPGHHEPRVKVWTRRRFVRTPYCNVGVDADDAVEWTYYGVAWIVP